MSQTAGLVPQLVAIAVPYGIPVYPCSGFNTGKRAAAQRSAAGCGAPVLCR
ncbi:hypothetical protein AB0I82_33145 [Streptomyces sp. NPDC050315]|uniref:hypothetical protein n=1 Tax=Streptomyces sp. NPDC050315 TaxID=3155039 RepID=UPI003414DEEA